MTDNVLWFDEWAQYAEKHYSPTTVSIRKYRISRFLKWLPIDLKDVKRKTIRAYCDFLYETLREYQKEKKGTIEDVKIDDSINKALQAIRNFFEFLEEQEVIEDVPISRKMFRDHPQNNQPDTRRKISIKDVKMLYRALKNKPDKRTILVTLAETGMRPREARKIDIKDVNLDTREIMIRFGKGRKGQKRRIVIMSLVLQTLLKRWVKYRNMLPMESKALFVTKNGKRISKVDFARLFTKECEELSLSHITPARFRPTWISWAEKQGMNDKIRYLQVGHTHPDVHISIYTQKNNKERLEEHDRIGSLLA